MNPSDTVDVRRAYSRLHDLLSSEIESNGFLKEHEAISFLSAMFSNLMGHKFLSNYITLSENVYANRHASFAPGVVHVLLDALEQDVRKDSKDLGISDRFVDTFYSKNSSRDDFLFSLSLIKVEEGDSMDSLKEKMLSCLIEFLKVSIKDVKRTYYQDGNMFSNMSGIMIWLMFVLLLLVLFYSKSDILFWMRF